MPNGQPTPPSPPSEEQPLAEPFQNYQKLRQRLNEDFANALPGYMDRGLLGFSEPFRLEQGLGAAGILATRAIKFIPRNTEITQEILSEALLAAQDELAATDDWFDIVLPGRKKRLRLAQELASAIDTQSAAAQAQLQAAAFEQDTYAEAALTTIPDQETLASEIQAQLQAEGYSPEEAKQVAGATLLEHEQRAVKYGAAPPPIHFQSTVKQELQRTDRYNREDRYDQIAQKVSESTQEKVSRRAEAIGLSREKLAKDPTLVSKTFKYARGLPKFEKLDKTIKVAGAVVHPIRTVKGVVRRPVVALRKAVIRRVGDAAIKTLIKVLTKLGLGTLVRRVEQAIISVGTGGLGLPIAILQEVVSVGIGRLNRTIKNIARDWKEAIRTGLRSPLEGSIRVLGTAFDNAGAVVGAAVGAGYGGVGGALIGAALGSVIPVLGTAVGGIIGSLVGAFAGAGYGAKKGYELRRKIQRKLMIFLAMRALGLNPFKIAWALLKAAATWALGQIAPLIQTVISRATIGARGLIGIARFGPQVLAQQAAAGEGLFAQAIRGAGHLFGNIPSGIARAFNTVTGWISGQTVSTAASIEAVATEVVTAGPGQALPWASVAGTFGLVFFLSLVTYIFLITVFHVTPTDVVPYVEARALGSKYIGISKIACVGAVCNEDTLQLENASVRGPYTIQYTIRVTAKDQALTNVRITDTYAAYGDGSPPTPPPQEWDGSLTIAAGSTWEQRLTLSIPRSTQWDDAALTNIVMVTANVIGEAEPVQNSESVLICFGDCPVCPPTLSPLDSPSVGGGYRFGNAPTNVCLNPPPEHRGIDISSSSFTVYSTFACPAVVEYVADSAVGLGTYIVLRSGPWYAFFAHMVEGSYLWRVGDTVAGRQPIGVMDSTGNSSGNHVHYEIRDATLGSVNPSDHCEPPVSVNPCSWGDWGVGDAAACAI